MTSITSEQPVSDPQGPPAELESDIGLLVRGEVAPSPPSDTGPSSNNDAATANGLIDRISINSSKEIANLIAELQNLRDFLFSEGDRVQHETKGYLRLTEQAMMASKTIVEATPRWR